MQMHQTIWSDTKIAYAIQQNIENVNVYIITSNQIKHNIISRFLKLCQAVFGGVCETKTTSNDNKSCQQTRNSQNNIENNQATHRNKRKAENANKC